MSKTNIDLFIRGGGIDFDAGQQPIYTDGLVSIAQDIKHAILESGLARELQAERNQALRSDVLTRIEMLIETDVRIEPGSASASEVNASTLALIASAQQETIKLTISLESGHE